MNNATVKKLTQAQEHAIYSTKNDILVSASAGTGKTFVMVERIIRLLCEGNDIDNFLVLTFTKDATAEMKKRIELKIVEKISQLTHSNTDDKLILHLSAQVEKLSQSNISTIDSFCKRILQKYFFVIGASSKFKVLDDKQAILLKNLAFKRLTKERFAKKDEAFIRTVDIYSSSRNMNGLKDIINSYYNYIGSLKCSEEFLFSAPKHYIDSLLCEKIIIDNVHKEAAKLQADAEAAIALMQKRPDVFKKNIELFLTLEETLSNLIACDKIDSFGKILDCFTPFNLSTVKSDNILDTDIKETCKKTKSNITDLFKKLYSEYGNYDLLVEETKKTARIVTDLTDVVREFAKIYEEIKQKKKSLDFADLEQKALTLLENAEVLEELNKEFRFVFIDEYQDINALQDAILSKFSHGSTFKVGDSKQSIYGFRNSDVEIFMDEVSKQGENVISLNQNFRSDNTILSFVNELFSGLMTDTFGGTNYKDNGSFAFSGAIDNTAVKMIVNISEKTKVDDAIEKIYSVKNADKSDTAIKSDIFEGKIISQKILELVSTNEYKFKDIAILARTSSLAMSIYEGLRSYNISSFVLGNKSATASTAVLEVISIINVIDNLKQDIELATALSSNFFGFSKSELLQIRRKKNKAPFYECLEIARADGLLDGKVEDFYKKIEHYRLIASTMGIFEALWRFINETDYFAKLYNEVDGVRKVTEAKNFIAVLKNSSDDNSVKSVINTYNNIKDDIKLNEDVSCGNFVTIMTMHKAKGLEFPVVFIAGVSSPFSKQDLRNKIYLDKELKVCSMHYDTINRTRSNTLVSLASKYTLSTKNLQEELRLWYVALTRAKKMLYLVNSVTVLNHTDTVNIFDFLEEKNKRSNYSCPFDMFFSKYRLKSLVADNKINMEFYINSHMNEVESTTKQLLIIKDNINSSLDINLLDLPLAKDFIKVKSAASSIGRASYKEPEFVAEIPFGNLASVDHLQENDSLNSNGDLSEVLNILDRIDNVYICDRKLDISSNSNSLHFYKEDSDESIPINKKEAAFTSDDGANLSTDNKHSANLAIEIGTAYHKLIENVLPFSDTKSVREKLDELACNNLIDNELKNHIQIDKVVWAKNLDLYKNKTAYSEKSFILRTRANEVFDTTSTEFVLIQGVVDCILLNNNKVSCDIVDYKITKSTNDRIIKERYAPQMSVYKNAVEQILKLKVDNIYIISVLNEKVIKM